jgi:cytochrome c oxidase assembly protein subunit 15
VVDWPNSFGYNMVLYPLSRMTGGIYYEHSHRLFGMLVGLTTLVQAVVLQLLDDRRWLKGIAWGSLALVALQGILGGLRVTGHFTLATSPSEVVPNIMLAVFHGAAGQLFFATMVGLAVFTSRSWKNASQATTADRHAWPWLLVVLLIAQLVLGAIQRHLAHGLALHVVMAVIVTVLALIVGLKAWGGRTGVLLIQRFGLAVVIVVSAQVFLGLSTYVAIGGVASGTLAPIVRVVISTAHQATGAVVLACAVGLALWNSRAAQGAGSGRAR